MTKVAKLIADEAREEREVVVRMLLREYEEIEIAKCTGLSLDEVDKIKRETADKLIDCRR